MENRKRAKICFSFTPSNLICNPSFLTDFIFLHISIYIPPLLFRARHFPPAVSCILIFPNKPHQSAIIQWILHFSDVQMFAGGFPYSVCMWRNKNSKHVRCFSSILTKRFDSIFGSKEFPLPFELLDFFLCVLLLLVWRKFDI